MYNLNDPDIIPTLTALVGDRKKAVDLYLAAQHVCEITEGDTFTVRMEDSEWIVPIDNITSSMNNALRHD
jgi:hypothetical protein